MYRKRIGKQNFFFLRSDQKIDFPLSLLPPVISNNITHIGSVTFLRSTTTPSPPLSLVLGHFCFESQEYKVEERGDGSDVRDRIL
jgi:hypothetical protein